MIGYVHTGVRDIIQSVLLGHLLHTISYTIPPLLTGPPQKRKLPDKQFCAAGFALLNLPKGKSLGRSKPETNSYAQALATHCVGFLLYPSSAELPYAK
jgi:hypothetical protein